MTMEDFDARYTQVYDPFAKSLLVRHKSVRDGAATLEEGLDMLAILLKQYQTKFYTHATDPNMIWLPFSFVQLKEGLQGRLDDGTVRTIEQLINNPATNEWEGWVILDSPVTEEGHFTFLNDNFYVRFVHDTPMENIGKEGSSTSETLGTTANQLPPAKPTITWVIVRREPGTVGSDPFTGRRERSPRIREYVKHAGMPGNTIEIRGQWFDNLVEFSCWSTDHYSASRLLLWFERFVQLHTWILKRYGVKDVLYWERMRDTVVTRWRQDMVSRTVRYYIRTEQLETVVRGDLLSVNISLVPDAITGSSNELRYVADQLVSGQISDEDYRQLFRDLSGNYLFGNINFIDNGG